MKGQVVLQELIEPNFPEPVDPVGYFVEQDRAGEQIGNDRGDRLGVRPTRQERKQNRQGQSQGHGDEVRCAKGLEFGSRHAALVWCH